MGDYQYKTKLLCYSVQEIFIFFQWENHAKSLNLEEQTLSKITSRIQEKVMNSTGTWIDWQYLLDAAHLLKKV